MAKKKPVIEMKPVVGAKIVADYMENGTVKRRMNDEMGKVTEVGDFTFKSKGSDGKEYTRRYTFNANNGIRLHGFIYPAKRSTRTKEK